MKMLTRGGPNKGRLSSYWMIPACALLLMLGLAVATNANAAPLDTSPDIVAYNDTSQAPVYDNAAANISKSEEVTAITVAARDIGAITVENTTGNADVIAGSEGRAHANSIVAGALTFANTATAPSDTGLTAANTGDLNGTNTANNAAHTIGSPSTEAGASTTANTDARITANAEKDVGAGVLNA